MVERGPYVSYANCGPPCRIGNVIEKESSLRVATEQMLRGLFEIDDFRVFTRKLTVQEIADLATPAPEVIKGATMRVK